MRAKANQFFLFSSRMRCNLIVVPLVYVLLASFISSAATWGQDIPAYDEWNSHEAIRRMTSLLVGGEYKSVAKVYNIISSRNVNQTILCKIISGADRALMEKNVDISVIIKFTHLLKNCTCIVQGRECLLSVLKGGCRLDHRNAILLHSLQGQCIYPTPIYKMLDLALDDLANVLDGNFQSSSLFESILTNKEIEKLLKPQMSFVMMKTVSPSISLSNIMRLPVSLRMECFEAILSQSKVPLHSPLAINLAIKIKASTNAHNEMQAYELKKQLPQTIQSIIWRKNCSLKYFLPNDSLHGEPEYITAEAEHVPLGIVMGERMEYLESAPLFQFTPQVQDSGSVTFKLVSELNGYQRFLCYPEFASYAGCFDQRVMLSKVSSNDCDWIVNLSEGTNEITLIAAHLGSRLLAYGCRRDPTEIILSFSQGTPLTIEC